MSDFFRLEKQCSQTDARAGLIQTEHGKIETPVFMPVGTGGAVKAVPFNFLNNHPIILANTYHLYLRPGTEVLKYYKGLHNFIGWEKPVLTDSGGYQIFSLAKLNNITDEGFYFRSHIDGSPHFFSPEKVIELQNLIGADIIMPLDECLPFTSGQNQVENSVKRTLAWAQKAAVYHNSNPAGNFLFGIVQGAGYQSYRKMCAAELTALGLDGYAIGGLSVGEEKKQMYALTGYTAALLPERKPRYLMGVGAPEDIVESVKMGIDMFDCVLPTRNARNATVYTGKGKILLRNNENKYIDYPIEEDCGCYTCQHFSRGYLRHLFKSREINACILASIHNLFFYKRLMSKMRQAILAGNFKAFYENFFNNYKI
ncbi:MAG TPA: tRNA guanosine(34) transglycosylase Tgt [Spirochaetota bacterium]|nr:tRNA guanosine(34) transglycosylase Tgt [Spirochaetota bacterium]